MNWQPVKPIRGENPFDNRIRDDLIRIRILLLFFTGNQDVNKVKFFPKFFCLLLTVCTFASVFKDNKLLRSHKTVDIEVMLVD